MHTPGLRITGRSLQEHPEQLTESLELARNLGFRAVEMVPDDFELISCARVNMNNLNQLKAVLDEYKFRISIHAPLRLNLMDREDPLLHLEVLSCCAEICRHLRAEILVCHPGRYVDNVYFHRYGRPMDHMDDNTMQKLRHQERNMIEGLARKFPDITFALENHRPYLHHSPYSYGEKIESLVQTLEDMDRPNIKMTLDTGHLNLAASFYKQDILEDVSLALPWIAHVHVHDNHGITSYYTEKDKVGMLPFGRGDEHDIPGSGTFPFADFFSLLEGYPGIYLLELTQRYLYPARIQQGMKSMNRFLNQAGSGQDK
ncbi:MAG: sugar phosphate isomerase/epimerase family protein [Desulfonatronovibrio sp.]